MPSNSESNIAHDAFVAQMAEKLTALDAPASVTAVADAAPIDAPETQDPPASDDAPAETPKTPETDATDDAEPAEAAPAEDAPEETEETDPAPEASQAAQDLAAHGAKLTLDDVPEAARPFVAQRIKEIEAGLHRARQRDTDRVRELTTEITELRTDARLWKERPADVVVKLIRDNPALAEQINATLDELDGRPIATEAHEHAVARHRETARVAEQQANDQATRDAAEAEALDARLAARLDTAGVQPSTALQLLIERQIALNETQTGRRHITAAQVDAIADAHIETVTQATERGRRLERRNASARRTETRAAVRQAAAPLTPGSGEAPGVGRVRPTSDDEFIHAYIGAA